MRAPCVTATCHNRATTIVPASTPSTATAIIVRVGPLGRRRYATIARVSTATQPTSSHGAQLGTTSKA